MVFTEFMLRRSGFCEPPSVARHLVCSLYQQTGQKGKKRNCEFDKESAISDIPPSTDERRFEKLSDAAVKVRRTPK